MKNKETIEEFDYLKGFINQFEEGHELQELSNDNWTVSQFLEWMKLNNFKIVKTTYYGIQKKTCCNRSI